MEARKWGRRNETADLRFFRGDHNRGAIKEAVTPPRATVGGGDDVLSSSHVFRDGRHSSSTTATDPPTDAVVLLEDEALGTLEAVQANDVAGTISTEQDKGVDAPQRVSSAPQPHPSTPHDDYRDDLRGAAATFCAAASPNAFHACQALLPPSSAPTLENDVMDETLVLVRDTVQFCPQSGAQFAWCSKSIEQLFRRVGKVSRRSTATRYCRWAIITRIWIDGVDVVFVCVCACVCVCV